MHGDPKTKFLLMLPVRESLGTFRIVDDFNDATDLLPIGMVQNLTPDQTKQIQRFFELGFDLSESYINGTLGISKLSLNTETLLKYFNFVKDNQDYYFRFPVQRRKIIFSILNTIFEEPISLLIAMYKKSNTFDTDISGDTATDSENTGGYNITEYPDRIIELKNCVLNAYSIRVSSNLVMIAQNLQFSFIRIKPVSFEEGD